MSAQFNDLTNYKGLVQLFEKEVGLPRGTVSGDTDRLKEFTADVNMAWDDFVAIAIQSSGTWQFDDSNQTDYPIITTNLVSGQRDYSFTTDGSGNLILDIYRVFVADTGGVFSELTAVDAQSSPIADVEGFTNGKNLTGVPTKYDKTANGIFLDQIPNYNYTNGLKIYINREPSYFISSDTTKKPGVPGIFHKYFFLKPAQTYAARLGLPIAGGRLRNGAYTGLLATLQELETDIATYFAKRTKDERPRFQVNQAGANSAH